MNLDGNDVIKAVPFDAHDQVLRASKPVEELTEYPKVVDHIPQQRIESKPVEQLVPVVVNSPEEEQAYRNQAKKPEQSQA